MIAVFTIVVVTLIPIYKKVIYNPDFASTKKAQIIEKQQGIKSYVLTSVSPEIVWDYGKSIPVIDMKGDSPNLPPESKFGLMTERILRLFSANYRATRLKKFTRSIFTSLKRKKSAW